MFSDSWVEQGDQHYAPNYFLTISLLKAYSDTNYWGAISCHANVNKVNSWATNTDIVTLTNSTIGIFGYAANINWIAAWICMGY